MELDRTLAPGGRRQHFCAPAFLAEPGSRFRSGPSILPHALRIQTPDGLSRPTDGRRACRGGSESSRAYALRCESAVALGLAEWQRRPGPWCGRRSPDAPPCFSPFKIRPTNRTRLLLTQRIHRSTEWVSCSCLCRLHRSATKTVLHPCSSFQNRMLRKGSGRGGCMSCTQILAPSNRLELRTAEAQLHVCRESPSLWPAIARLVSLPRRCVDTGARARTRTLLLGSP